MFNERKKMMNNGSRMSLVALGAIFIALVSQTAGATAIQNRVINGTELTQGELPFLAYVESFNAVNVSQCTGSIIDNRHILTAAHCVTQPNTTYSQVKLGCHHWLEKCEVYEVESPSIHRLYQNHGLYSTYDIAILRTKQEIKFTGQSGFGSIGPIELPASSVGDFSNDEWLTVAGWGTGFVPKKASVVTHGLGSKGEFEICAGSSREDAEKGDSGGPLFRTDLGTGSSTIVGIVSYNNATCGGELGVIYTRVSFFLDWINELRSKATK